MPDRLAKAWYALLAITVAFILGLMTFSHTTETPITKDARQNTSAAYHLVHAGVISTAKKETERPSPQMRREPLPIVVTSAFLLLHPAFDKPYTMADLVDGRLTETVKGVNAIWRFLTAILIFLLCLELFPDRRVAALMAVICIIVTESFFLSRPGVVNTMYTELPEVAMMLLAAWCAVRFVRGKTKARALWLGVVLGLLALCKASFLYIGLGFIFLLLVTDRGKGFQHESGKAAWGNCLLTYAMIALAMFATIAPWIARNTIVFGNPQIASGTDASVLGIRMLLMEEPLVGQVYLYSPDSFKWVIGPLTGFSDSDLRPGGRLEAAATVKLNRDTIFAERMEAQGKRGKKNEWIKHAVVKYAIENPLLYIASIGVFAYRGMWFMARAGALLNLMFLTCFFGVFFWALFNRNQVLISAFGLPAGLFFFISFFSHALPRYNMAMTPFVILSVLWFLTTLGREAYGQLEIRRLARHP